MEEYKVKLLKLVSKWDARDTLGWDEELTFYVNCSDVFMWGCSDAEDVASQEDVDLLEQCFRDCPLFSDAQIAKMGIPVDREDTDCYAAVYLYAARKRGIRPQGAMYEHISAAHQPLFDACGPLREVGLGNPVEHPTQKHGEDITG